MGKFRFSGFSGTIGVFYELGQYDLLYTLWDHTMSMKHPMRLVCIGYTPGHQENQILPKVGQDDLFGALKAELAHVNLIRNILLMQ